jgi:hypothetical protein
MYGCQVCAWEESGKNNKKDLRGMPPPAPCACKKAMEYDRQWTPNNFKKDRDKIRAAQEKESESEAKLESKLTTTSSMDAFSEGAMKIIDMSDTPKKKPGRPKKRA